MAKIKINLSGAGARTLIPDGTYHARITKVEIGQGANHEYADVTFNIEAGEFMDRKINDRIWFSPAASWRTGQLLTALGLEYEEEDNQEIDTDDWLQRECEIVVATEKSDDDPPKLYLNVIEFIALD